MANTLKNNCENANTHTHGGVGTFTKEKKLELMWINSVKKRRRKEVTVSDRTLASTGLAHPVSGSSEGAGVGLRPDAGSLHDQTLAGCVRFR